MPPPLPLKLQGLSSHCFGKRMDKEGGGMEGEELTEEVGLTRGGGRWSVFPRAKIMRRDSEERRTHEALNG